MCSLTEEQVTRKAQGWGSNITTRLMGIQYKPFTPESDQCQNSPAASQEIWHHTVWRTWLFIAYSDERWLYYKFLLHHSYNCFLKGWENTLFELRSERDKLCYYSTVWSNMFKETIRNIQLIQPSFAARVILGLSVSWWVQVKPKDCIVETIYRHST